MSVCAKLYQSTVSDFGHHFCCGGALIVASNTDDHLGLSPSGCIYNVRQAPKMYFLPWGEPAPTPPPGYSYG